MPMVTGMSHSCDNIFSNFFFNRKLSITKPPEASSADDKLVKAAKKITKKIAFNFDSMDFDNPALQKHYAALQVCII